MANVSHYHEQKKIFHQYWKMLLVGTAIGLPLTLYMKPKFRDKPWLIAGALTLTGFTIKSLMLKD